MSEHDDDLDSTVDEAAEMETDTFPDTGGAIDAINWEADDSDEYVGPDEDDIEL